MKRKFTGCFDFLGTPIFAGDIIELHCGYEGYWLVFRRDGKWMKKEIQFGGVEPLEYSLSHGNFFTSPRGPLRGPSPKLLLDTLKANLHALCHYLHWQEDNH